MPVGHAIAGALYFGGVTLAIAGLLFLAVSL